jgi:hypothetical protein
MPLVTLRAHFNGEHIILDEPFALTPDMELIITVLSQQASDENRDAWLRLSSQRLAAAYEENEPEYSRLWGWEWSSSTSRISVGISW